MPVFRYFWAFPTGLGEIRVRRSEVVERCPDTGELAWIVCRGDVEGRFAGPKIGERILVMRAPMELVS